MPLTWWALIGVFVALLVNRAADCWLNPAGLQCGLTTRPQRQWLVLLGMPLVFVVIAWMIESPAERLVIGLFGPVLILLAVVDLEQMRVPDIVVWPAFILALLLSWQIGRLSPAVVGALLAFGIFSLIWFAGRRLYGEAALGSGDVKLAVLLGAVLSYPAVLFSLLLGILLAGLTGAYLLMAKKASRRDTIPYGFYLAVAGVIVLLGGAVFQIGFLSL